MGYYSNFDISILDKDMNEIFDDKIRNEIFDELAEASGYDKYVFTGYNEAKWYSHGEDMNAISLQHPEYTFFVERVGENRDDHWHCYYRAGKQAAYQARIEFDKFDEKDFKEFNKNEW